MKPLMLLFTPPIIYFLEFQSLASQLLVKALAVGSWTTVTFIPVEPPPSGEMQIFSDVLLGLAIAFSLASVVRIITYPKKQGELQNDHHHNTAMWLLLVTIILAALSMISFMFTEPGMKPHPLAEPDRPAPILIADPRTTESLFLLIGIMLASACMISLYKSEKTKPHSHGWSIGLSVACFLSILAGALHYWLTI